MSYVYASQYKLLYSIAQKLCAGVRWYMDPDAHSNDVVAVNPLPPKSLEELEKYLAELEPAKNIEEQE